MRISVGPKIGSSSQKWDGWQI